MCLPNTRVDVLQKISRWAEGEDQQCLFWLSGMAGTGKSTIACTVARGYSEQGRLAASFFFSRGGGDAGNARKFVTSIALQPAVHILPVQRHICDAVAETVTLQANLSQINGLSSWFGRFQGWMQVAQTYCTFWLSMPWTNVKVNTTHGSFTTLS